MNQQQPENPQPDTPQPDAPQPEAVAAPAPAEPAPAPTPASVPLRERVFRLRSVIAVGAAGLVIGAGAGVGTTLLASGHDDHDGRPGWSERMGPGGDVDRHGPGGHRNAPEPGTGQLPPATTPQESTPQDGESSTGEDDDTTN